MLAFLAIAVLVGVAAGAGDFVECFYVRAVADRQPRRAGLMSSAMYLVSLVGFLAVFKVSVWLVVPELLGVGLGSWLAVRRQRRAHERDQVPGR